MPVITTPMVRATAAAGLLAAGCGGTPDEQPPPTPIGCRAGEWAREDGSCVAAGLPPDLACAPGSWRADDGSCVPAGVAPDGCGEGFVHDGDGGCDPVLPAQPCGDGLMAVPGDTSCEPPAPCGAGAWGDIPVDAGTEFVDGTFAGQSDGSQQAPWATIQAGVDAAAPGAVVAVAAGDYAEDVRIEGKAVRLWGRCPAMVEVAGSAAGFGAIDVRDGASTTEIHALAAGGARAGVVVSGAVDVHMTGLWIHDTGREGVRASDALGVTRVTVERSLVERARDDGMIFSGVEAVLDSVLVRDTVVATPQGFYGRGVAASDGAARGMLTCRRSLIERNPQFGVLVGGTDALVESTVIRESGASAPSLGAGLFVVERQDTRSRAAATLRTSVVAQSHGTGLYLTGSDLEVDSAVIRDGRPNAQGTNGRAVEAYVSTTAATTLAIVHSLVIRSQEVGIGVYGVATTIDGSAIRDTEPSTLGFGRGLSVQYDPIGGGRSTLALASSAVERNHEEGILLQASDASIEGVAVRDTWLDPVDHLARGIAAQEGMGMRTIATVRASLVERSSQHGIVVLGSDITLEQSVVRDTTASDLGVFGRAIQLQSPCENQNGTLVCDPTRPSKGMVRATLIENAVEAGVACYDSDLTFDASIVRTTAANTGGAFGDALLVAAFDGAATAAVTKSRLEGSARGGLALFGAHASYQDSELTCQSFDLIGEPYQGVAFELTNLGGNLCGCPQPQSECLLATSGLPPPAPL
jgi:hypothetical protein